MKQVYRVTGDGFFVEDVLLPNNATVPDDCVTVQSPEGFNWPRWTGTRGEDSQGTWGEGGGIWHKQPDGTVDPAKRHAEITLEDGTKLQRAADGVLKKNRVTVPKIT